MTSEKERKIAANNWNDMQIGFLIDFMERTKAALELFENLGREASELIDSQITELESLRTDYRIEE
jgi:hypothetical protein